MHQGGALATCSECVWGFWNIGHVVFISAVILLLDCLEPECEDEEHQREWDKAKYPTDGRCFLIADPEMPLFKALTMDQMAEFIANEELDLSFSNVLAL